MSLDVYRKNGWIRTHKTSREEITRLLAIADRDIRQSQSADLQPEWRFDIAYNASLQLCVAVVAAAGFQAERQSKHQRTIECTRFVLLSQEHVDFLTKCRIKRNTSVYEEIGAISDMEARELLAFATELRSTVRAWLKRHHPHLLA